MPQRASDKDWGVGFSADERKSYVNRLGNLALLQKGPNGKIGSKSFADKQAVLKASAFVLTQEAGMEAAWSRKEVDARQVKMAKLALKVWPRGKP